MSHADAVTPAGEFARGWKVLLAAALGVTCGITAVPIYTIGAFVGPLQQEFGWSRGAIQTATLFAYATLIFAGPAAGVLVDRLGARRVAIWSVLGIALAVASAAVLVRSLPGLYAAYALIGVLGAGTGPAVWTRAVSGWFDRRRGLALGLTLMGTGIFATLGPRYVTWAIDAFGWRAAFIALAAVPLVVVLPVVLLWFRERSGAGREGTPADESGLDLTQAARTRQFWIVAITYLIFSTAISGFIGSFIPMLTDGGLTARAAAETAAIIGISVIIGRASIGLVLDHVQAALVSTVAMSLPAIGCLLWGLGVSAETGPVLAAILVGLAAGAEFDLVAYMTARYFGLKHFGKLTGILFSSVIAGGAFGPMLFGFGFDRFGSYGPVLLVCAALFIAAGVCQAFLGRYPDRVRSPT